MGGPELQREVRRREIEVTIVFIAATKMKLYGRECLKVVVFIKAVQQYRIDTSTQYGNSRKMNSASVGV